MNKNKILIPIIILTVIIILLIIIINPTSRYNKIKISESMWNDIINSRTENKQLIIQDIKFNNFNLIVDESNNTIYYSLINESKNKYNPKVSFRNTNNTKIAVLDDEITDEKVKTNYKFKLMIYSDTEYHIYNLVFTDLPILNIDYIDNNVSKSKKIPIEIYLFDNLSNTPQRVIISSGKLRKNENIYEISLDMLTPGKNKRDNKISIFNMRPDSEYMLKPDNTNLNTENKEQVNYQNQKVLLFVNNQYKGIYLLSDNPDKQLQL